MICCTATGILSTLAVIVSLGAEAGLPGAPNVNVYGYGVPLPTPPGWTPPVAPSVQPTPPTSVVAASPVYSAPVPAHYVYAAVFVINGVGSYGPQESTVAKACLDYLGYAESGVGQSPSQVVTSATMYDSGNGVDCHLYKTYIGSDPAGHDVVQECVMASSCFWSRPGLCDGGWFQLTPGGQCYQLISASCPTGYTLSGTTCNLTGQAKKPSDGVCAVVTGIDGFLAVDPMDPDCGPAEKEAVQAENDKQAGPPPPPDCPCSN